MRSRIATANSGPVLGDVARVDGSMLLIPTLPSDAVCSQRSRFGEDLIPNVTVQ